MLSVNQVVVLMLTLVSTLVAQSPPNIVFFLADDLGKSLYIPTV